MKTISSFLSFLFFSFLVQAQTNVSGFISQNTTWDLAGSPYILTGNALLSYGFTLTIEPGVVVKFNTDKALQIDGTLIAIGTPENRILFTSNQPAPAPGDWAKIHFADSSTNAVFDVSGNYLSGCIMKYCDVEFGGGIGYGVIHNERSSPFFSNCSIRQSIASGFYSDAAFRLDSSSIRHCSGAGLETTIFTNMEPMTVFADTFEYNDSGAIILGLQKDVIISNSTFRFNIGFDCIIYNSNDNMRIEENYFENNTCDRIIGAFGTTHNVYRCNRFVSNFSDSGVVFSGPAYFGGIITENIFDTNTGNGSFGYSCLNLYGSPLEHLEISNNLFRNNLSSGGCFKITPMLYSLHSLSIKGNVFKDNTGVHVMKLNGYQSTTNVDFLYMKYNSFNDPAAQYELFNAIRYGTSDVYADSNYWGGTGTHIDSVIYDYFDLANLSVVYYIPALNNELIADTTCHSIGIGINEPEENLAGVVYPNPFSEKAVIRFDRLLKNATLHLFDMTGQRIRSQISFSGRECVVEQEKLLSGIYIYTVEEKGKNIARGKMVIL